MTHPDGTIEQDSEGMWLWAGERRTPLEPGWLIAYRGGAGFLPEREYKRFADLESPGELMVKRLSDGARFTWYKNSAEITEITQIDGAFRAERLAREAR